MLVDQSPSVTVHDPSGIEAALSAAMLNGTVVSLWARLFPHARALVAADRELSFQALNARCNRLARGLRALGLKAGDSVALMSSNRCEFAEVFWATRRIGLRFTPLNWHLTGEEAAYIVDDCDAKAVFVEARVAPAAALIRSRAPQLAHAFAIGGALDGYRAYEGLLQDQSESDLIISGGVNIYPAEVEKVLALHKAVADVAVIGVPNESWGEEVKAVVCLHPGFAPSPELAATLIESCREHLAHFKCPKSVVFVDSLPRDDSGKLSRRKVRAQYRQEG